MAIAFDAATNGSKTDSATSLTFAHTCGASANLLVVGIAGDLNGGNDDITGVTYNSVAMTEAYKSNSAFVNRYHYLYYLINPTTGSSQNVVVSCTNSHFLFGCAASYSGVKTSGQPDAIARNGPSGGATSLTSSITSVADNCWAVFMENGYNEDNPPSASTNLTRRAYDTAYGTGGLFDSNAAITPAGSFSGTTTRTTNTNPIGHVMATFAPSTASGALLLLDNYGLEGLGL